VKSPPAIRRHLNTDSFFSSRTMTIAAAAKLSTPATAVAADLSGVVASADGQEQGVGNGIVTASKRERGRDESTETSHVEPSRKKLRYSVFWV
jgi:hypothetical protein